jgi:uncharacterized membrane protein
VRELIAFVYADSFRAAEVMATIHRLHPESPPDVNDTVCVTCDAHGKVKLQYAQHPTREVLGLAFWQSLVRSLISPASPEPGCPGDGGAAAGCAAGRPLVAGIDASFSRELRAQLGPGNSAVLMLVRDVTRDRLAPQVSVFGGVILRTPIPDESAIPPDGGQPGTSRPAGTPPEGRNGRPGER